MQRGAARYRDYDQAQLDAQYNNRARFPDFEVHFERWAAMSAAARQRLPVSLDLAYGPTTLEQLDVVPAAAGNAAAPIYVFLHGGYWYSLDKADYTYVAAGMRPHGVATVVPNFGLAPECDMDTIVEHNRRALAWVWTHAGDFGGDPDRIYVCGHSAGGHLGLMLLATDWPRYRSGLPPALVKGVCAIGGIFDLEPIRLSFLNEKLHLDDAQVRRASPLRLDYPVAAPLSLIVAVDESDEFHRQSREMAARWRDLNYPVVFEVPRDLDHFNVVNDLGDPACPLVAHQLEQMTLAFSGTS